MFETASGGTVYRPIFQLLLAMLPPNRDGSEILSCISSNGILPFARVPFGASILPSPGSH
jgi:hypothetical protein